MFQFLKMILIKRFLHKQISEDFRMHQKRRMNCMWRSSKHSGQFYSQKRRTVTGLMTCISLHLININIIIFYLMQFVNHIRNCSTRRNTNFKIVIHYFIQIVCQCFSHHLRACFKVILTIYHARIFKPIFFL